jgi:hypothetical protein
MAVKAYGKINICGMCRYPGPEKLEDTEEEALLRRGSQL